MQNHRRDKDRAKRFCALEVNGVLDVSHILINPSVPCSSTRESEMDVAVRHALHKNNLSKGRN